MVERQLSVTQSGSLDRAVARSSELNACSPASPEPEARRARATARRLVDPVLLLVQQLVPRLARFSRAPRRALAALREDALLVLGAHKIMSYLRLAIPGRHCTDAPHLAVERPFLPGPEVLASLGISPLSRAAYPAVPREVLWEFVADEGAVVAHYLDADDVGGEGGRIPQVRIHRDVRRGQSANFE